MLLDRAARPPTPANLRAFMGRALGALRQLDDSWPFREPVDAQDVPDYYDIIKVVGANPVQTLLRVAWNTVWKYRVSGIPA